MAYATYSEFSERYPTRMSDAEVTSHFLAHAAHRLDSLLAGYFATPFSADNLTAKDLNMDLAYLMVLQRSKSPDDGAALAAAVAERIGALRAGREAMVTAGGAALYRASAEGGIWSTTQAFKPVFDLRDSVEQRVDPERLAAEEREDQ
jgi:hypothetical protein